MKFFDQSPERGGFNLEQYQRDLIDALGAQNEYWKATLDLLAKKELEHPVVIPNTITRNGDITVPDGMMSIRATTNQTAPVTITANGNIPIPVSSAYGAQQVTTGRLISLSVNGLQAGNIIWVQMLNERASVLNASGAGVVGLGTDGNPASVELTGQNVPYGSGILPWTTAPQVSAVSSAVLLTVSSVALAASATYSTPFIQSPSTRSLSLGVIVTSGGLSSEGLVWCDSQAASSHQWSQVFSSTGDALNTTEVASPYVYAQIINGSTAQTITDLELFSAGGI